MLTKKEYEVLKCISKHKYTELEYLIRNMDSSVNFRISSLLKSGAITRPKTTKFEGMDVPEDIYAITDTGIALLQDYQDIHFEIYFWRGIPILISLIALIFSGIALAKTLQWI